MAGLELVFWYWWVFAIFMLGIEVMVPGFFFLWLSVAGFVVGLELFLIPSTSVEIQLLLFSTLSIVSIYSWRRYGKTHHSESDQPLLNKRGAQHIGRVFLVSQAIENGRGKVKIGDSIWTVEGDDCAVDTKVKVVDIDGTVFTVKAVVDAVEDK
ncbi:MAG: NfeD family protein [Methylococcales symbiont of Iophon sp. n. MRB-2018]|nr:MAG: NfeD family protein [Methylococcales symbiont of Iophon sp. n. MRB-2018]KAF3980088.1 MAG: NfeD family protein [Methylococcales symbiont of Iophon sp. n. MRB-2018]